MNYKGERLRATIAHMDIMKLIIILNLLGTFPVKPNLYAPIMKKYLFYISQNYSFAILRPIQEILQARGDEVYWFFEGSAVNPDYLLKDESRIDHFDQIKTYLPDVVIAPANSIPTFMPGLKVAVFHGFDAGKLSRSGQNDHFKIRGCFDLYCTQGPNTTGPFRELQEKKGFFNVVETGWSALDPLFGTEDKPKINDKPVILFCSTFSKRLSCARELYETVADISRNGQWRWIVQFHPKMDRDTEKLYKDLQHENLTYIETDNIIPLLKKSDVMLCDSSSVISMFMVQKKPVVTFRNIDPGPHLLDINDHRDLEKTIHLALTHPPQLMQEIHLHIQKLHPYQDGKSSQRVVAAIDDVLNGKYSVKRRKPFNLFKNFKFRKRLNYWKF